MMHSRPRIGELLGQMVALSDHDVEEILGEQSATRRRFGEIALSWGLCQPEHIWSAWCNQLRDDVEFVDLQREGIDAQAVALVPADVARVFGAVPLRMSETEFVIAAAERLGDRSVAHLEQLLNRKVKFVLADKQQIDAALAAYYPA